DVRGHGQPGSRFLADPPINERTILTISKCSAKGSGSVNRPNPAAGSCGWAGIASTLRATILGSGGADGSHPLAGGDKIWDEPLRKRSIPGMAGRRERAQAAG